MKTNDWKPEVGSLLTALQAKGFALVSGDNGEEQFKFDPAKPADFLENLIACDEAHLTVGMGGQTRWLYLVLGNSPGELVSDYSVGRQPNRIDELLEAVTASESEKWTGRAQPLCEPISPALSEIRERNPGAFLPSGAELAAMLKKRKA
jgi:hypothetical protein